MFHLPFPACPLELPFPSENAGDSGDNLKVLYGTIKGPFAVIVHIKKQPDRNGDESAGYRDEWLYKQGVKWGGEKMKFRLV